MIDNGYILASGQFDDAKVAAGPNGALAAPGNTVATVSVMINGTTAQPSTDFTVKGSGDTAPVIDTGKANFVGTVVTVTGTAHDDDDDLQQVEVVIGIAGSSCVGTTSFTCTVDLGTVPDAGEHTAKLIATDSKGHTATLDVPLVISKATCFTTKNTEHIAAGRAHFGTLYTTSAFANGTNQYLSYATSWLDPTTSLQAQATAGSWASVSSCP